jgi:hypothetical protein
MSPSAAAVTANAPSSRRWCTGVSTAVWPSTASIAPVALTQTLRMRSAADGAGGDATGIACLSKRLQVLETLHVLKIR